MSTRISSVLFLVTVSLFQSSSYIYARGQEEESGDGGPHDFVPNNASEMSPAGRAFSDKAAPAPAQVPALPQKTCEAELKLRNPRTGQDSPDGTVRVSYSGNTATVINVRNGVAQAPINFTLRAGSTPPNLVFNENGRTAFNGPISPVLTLNVNGAGEILRGQIFVLGTASRAGVFGQSLRTFQCR